MYSRWFLAQYCPHPQLYSWKSSSLVADSEAKKTKISTAVTQGGETKDSENSELSAPRCQTCPRGSCGGKHRAFRRGSGKC